MSAALEKAELLVRLIKAIDQALEGLDGELGFINDRTAEMMAQAALLVLEHSGYHEEWMKREA